jgi:hypothetical protein
MNVVEWFWDGHIIIGHRRPALAGLTVRHIIAGLLP